MSNHSEIPKGSTPKHTPGPWKYKPLSEDTWFIFNRKDVITACGDENNARLIAAAPEMLEALKALVAYQADNETEYLGMQQIIAYQRAKAAIAKAEGRAEG